MAQLLGRGGVQSWTQSRPPYGRRARCAISRTGKNRANDATAQGGSARIGWPPADVYADLQLAELKDPLREVQLGPERRWLSDAREKEPTDERHVKADHPESEAREVALRELEEQDPLAELGPMSEYLLSHLMGRLLNEQLAGRHLTLESIPEKATRMDGLSLASEAGPPWNG